MSYYYILNANDKTVIFGSDKHEPSLPEGVEHLGLRRFDRPLTPEELKTELDRFLFQRGERASMESTEDEAMLARVFKMEELVRTWKLFKSNQHTSIRAFAKQVLGCHHDTASRLLNQDPTIEDELLERVYQRAGQWLATR